MCTNVKVHIAALAWGAENSVKSRMGVEPVFVSIDKAVAIAEPLPS
jgi:hypothetical protein